MNLYKNTTPFGLLSEEDQEALRNYKKGLEFYAGETWLPALPESCFVNTIVYRFKASLPSIDWKAVSRNYNWLARDVSGTMYLYESKPEIIKGMGYWVVTDSSIARETAPFASAKLGDCSWEESLVRRPISDKC